MKRSPLKRKRPLRKSGKSSVSQLKRSIQGRLRECAIERDGGCVLRHYSRSMPQSYTECGPFRSDGELILQAEHLVGRSNSASYADMDNIVCLCMRHHFYFKQQHGALYWELVRKHIGEERWEKVQEWERDTQPHRKTKWDWEQALSAL